jgi:hypothetical protein
LSENSVQSEQCLGAVIDIFALPIYVNNFNDFRSILRRSETRVARFFLVQTYHIGKKYSKRPQTIPNGHELYQMATKKV